MQSSEEKSASTEYVDDELPLPPFADLFGEGINKKKPKRLRDGQSSDESTGRWMPEEHRLFLEGIMLYGKDWKKMQPLIKSRSLVQIRTHAQKVFKKIGLKKANSWKKVRRGAVTNDDTGDIQADDGDTMVGAEELQLLQQMSQQMIQEEEEEQLRRQKSQEQFTNQPPSTHSYYEQSFQQSYEHQRYTNYEDNAQPQKQQRRELDGAYNALNAAASVTQYATEQQSHSNNNNYCNNDVSSITTLTNLNSDNHSRPVLVGMQPQSAYLEQQNQYMNNSNNNNNGIIINNNNIQINDRNLVSRNLMI